jgi:hypothetical protein
MRRLALAFIVVFPLIAIADAVGTAEKLMDDWLGLEIQKGQLQSNWSEREQELDQRLTLLDIESQRLKDVLAQRTEISGDVDQRRHALLEQQEHLEQEQSRLNSQLRASLQALKAIHPRLPPPLQSEWQTQLDQIDPEIPNNSTTLEHILALFKMLEEFDSRIAFHKGLIELTSSDSADSLMILVNQIYLGVGQGWYVSDDGKSYGYGRATPLGWKWWHGEEARVELGRSLDPEMITQVRRMLENPIKANFVALPIKIIQ